MPPPSDFDSEPAADQPHRAGVTRRPLVASDLERMRLPAECWRFRIQGAPDSARTLVETYLRRFPELLQKGTGLFLGGTQGTGKTGLAAVAAKEARIQGYSVFFTTVWDLRDAVRNRSTFDDRQLVHERAKEVDLLVLDNLRTAEDAQDPFFGRRSVEELITSRAGNRKATIVTSRTVLKDLDKPGAPWNGILQAGKLVYVSVEGPDLRARLHADISASLRKP